MALLAGQVYSLVSLITVTVVLGTQMVYGQPYELSPAQVILFHSIYAIFQATCDSQQQELVHAAASCKFLVKQCVGSWHAQLHCAATM